MRLENKIQAGFAVALAFLLLTGAAAWWCAHCNVESFRAVKHSCQALDQLEETLADKLNPATEKRGFAT